MENPLEQPDHKAFLDENDVPDFSPFQEELPHELSFLEGGDLLESENPKDQFITGTAKGEMKTTADLARFLPPEDLLALTSISHPVRDEYLDPLLNANLASGNLKLIYREWQAQEPNADLRKLAFLIAAVATTTQSTFQCAVPNLGPKKEWSQENHLAGHWDRGFVQLNRSETYQQISAEMGLDLIKFPSLSNLPTVATQIMGIGMFQTGFTSGRTLGDFFSKGKENWLAASEILDRKDGAMGALAQRIYGDIQSYVWSTEKSEGMEMVDYLLLKGTAQTFEKARLADAVRILHGLGHLQFSAPEIAEGEEDEVLIRYAHEKAAYGTHIELDTLSETALRAFQESYTLSELPKDGKLDTSTYQALIAGGHQIIVGNRLIQQGFENLIEPIDPFAKAFRDYREGDFGLAQLSRRLLDCFPAQDPDKVNTYFEQLPPLEYQRLAYDLTRKGEDHQLRQINLEVVSFLSNALASSGKPEWDNALQRLRNLR